MTDQWVISLGAGREQLPLIRAIQAEGFRCLAYDKNENAEGRPYADAFEAISNRDVDAILNIPHGVGRASGVMAAGSEVPDVMAILGHRLGCPNVPVATGMLLKDKLRYKEVLKAAGVPHTEVSCDNTVGSELAEYPAVIKPRVGSGSRHVALVNNEDESYIWRRTLWQINGYIMERYQPGPQISSETLFWDGKAVTVAFADRFYSMTVTGPKFVEYGGCMPSHWESEKPAAHKIILQAAEALGISRGTLKCDLVLTDQGPKIIELTARLSGGPLSELVLQSSGVDYLRQAVRIVCGIEPHWPALQPTKREEVAVDMLGNRLPWGDTRTFIKKELGKCAS